MDKTEPYESFDKENKSGFNNLDNISVQKKCPCTFGQLLAIFVPISLAIIIAILLIVLNKSDEEKIPKEANDGFDKSDKLEEFDEFDEYKESYNYATLTPKGGYNNIYIHLGGISETADKYLNFFKSNRTIIPAKTKLYFLTGNARVMKYLEDYYNYSQPVPAWFNVDSDGNLICGKEICTNFSESKASLNYILDKIDEIALKEKMDYEKIYLGGFSQGGIMTCNTLLNSRHKLGGYLIFSGYIFDEHFPPTKVEVKSYSELTEEQKQILESKKDYHIIATHSFDDSRVFYNRAIEMYYTYFRYYTDFRIYSFGNLDHYFEEQPVLPLVRTWLKESMGK